MDSAPGGSVLSGVLKNVFRARGIPRGMETDYGKAWDDCVAKHRRNLEAGSPPWFLRWVRLWFFDRRWRKARPKAIADLERYDRGEGE